MKAFHSLFPASLHVLMTLSSNNNAALAQNLKKSQPVVQPRNRNHILSPDLITPTAGKQIGNLIKRFKFFFESHIIVGNGEDYPEPYSEIYERCGPWNEINVTADGKRQGPGCFRPRWYNNTFWKGGCNGGHMYGDLKGLYLAGEYTGDFSSDYLNFAQFQSDVYGPEGYSDDVDVGYDIYADNSKPGTPKLTLKTGGGWLYTDFCNEEGIKEWLKFETLITSFNHQMFVGYPYESSTDSVNMYALDVEKSRGCEGKYITFALYGEDYSNPKSTEDGFLPFGYGCNPGGACSVNGKMYELVDIDEDKLLPVSQA